MSSVDATTVEEEACIELLLPWHCYCDQFKTHRQYKSLASLCDSEGVICAEVISAIKFNNGNMGSFHFASSAEVK